MEQSSRKRATCIYSADEKLGLKTAGAADLEKLLAPSEDLKNLRVVVISVAGRFRQGKSFLLNFMIKYLRSGGDPNWINSEAISDGFEWRHSRKRVTQGVLLWSEVFKVQRPNGEDVAVLLMDTQGVFDTRTTVKECTGIFSFSVLLSSTQIFNIKHNLQGDDLSQLELFTKYGQVVADLPGEASSSNKETPFQDLVFLVRDWHYANEVPYGWNGGRTVLNEELSKVGLTGELRSMREHIRNSFKTVRCHLLPHPGKIVDSSDKFKGNIADIDGEFLHHLQDFITSLLAPANLVPKKLNGEDVTLRDFFIHVETYARIFGSESLPSPTTLYDATVNATNNALLQRCFDSYHSSMKDKVQEDQPLDAALFEAAHRLASKRCLDIYGSSLKMGEPKQLAELLETLEDRIAAMLVQFRELNNATLTKSQAKAEVDRLTVEQRRLEEEAQKSGKLNEEMRAKVEKVQAEKRHLEGQHAEAMNAARKAIAEANSRRGFFGHMLGHLGSAIDGFVHLFRL